MHSIEAYLRELSEIRHSGAGVKETSYYPALSNLLNELGKTLKPKVKCIIHLRSKGAGIPDGGLFTADQLKALREDENPLAGQLPARAVLEVKPPKDDLDKTIASAQVAKYLGKYGLVLVTNYRTFALVKAGPSGKPVKLEAYALAEKEKELWALAAQPQKTAQQHGERLADYLRRVMLANAPLTTAADVAWFLASYARDARAKVEAADLPALAAIRKALEETLGLTFEGAKGEHFFRSTLVQTLFYGVFSAWVLWHGEEPTREDDFDWRTSAFYLRVPVIQALFEQVADASKLRALGLMEILDWAGATLNRVVRTEFFASFEQGQAVQYFYEPFLQAFDPELRKDLGVWYTPPEIVQYMVARVDTVLRQELHIADGLADSRVVVLDPCAGTGAYLVETLKRIAKTLRENGEGALLAGEVKRAAQERVFGFELLPAPYVVAHLQLGLLLQNLGAPLVDNERAGVFLTNALTGWEPPKEPKIQLPLFPELISERDAAEKVKREALILVILGNPPYNSKPKKGHVDILYSSAEKASPSIDTSIYKKDLNKPINQGGWGIKKFNLDDLYVRFFRLAERRIAEQTGRGVVCFISNFSYLSDPSFVVMRQRFLSEFDSLWFDCMNGDSRETGKLTPEGKPDPSVFSTSFNREGIRVGTAIGLMVRKQKRAEQPAIRFRQFWGVNKRADLFDSVNDHGFDSRYELAEPERNNRYSFRPIETTSEYLSWPRLPDLCAEAPSNGLMEKRGGALIDIDQSELESRMKMYYDHKVTWDTLKGLGTGLTVDAAGFDAKQVRPKVQALEKFDKSKLRRFALRPFDSRWCYYSDVSPLWNRARPTLWAQCWEGNSFLMTRPTGVANPEGVPLYFTSLLGDNDFLRGHAYYAPLFLRSETKDRSLNQISMLDESNASIANFSLSARAYLAALHVPNPDNDPDAAALIWMHALAIGYSPAYLRENADGIRQDWPRIPLPNSKELLLASAALGKQIAALLDTESPVAGVTSGSIRQELKQIAVVEGKTPLNLSITAGWGSAGKGGVTMPGKGKRIEREPAANEIVNGLGDTTHDVYLNEETHWRNVPSRVWEYTIGGYQVIKKWLSYREEKLLGRPITQDEAREVRDMARRIAAIILLEPQLDSNYSSVKTAAYKWPSRLANKK